MSQLNAAPPLFVPTGPVLVPPQIISLAQDSAASAVAIAHAVADLGLNRSVTGDDSDRATTIWNETLAQIARIQQLNGLTPLPFQPRQSPPRSADSTPAVA